MNQPVITEKQYIDYSRDMVDELKAVYKQIDIESLKQLNRAIYNGWTYTELQENLSDLFNSDPNEDMKTLSEVNKARPKRPPSKAMNWAQLKGKYNWKGKKYGSLIKKILLENQALIANSVLNTDKQRFEKNYKLILPKTARDKKVELPDISNVIRNSTSLIKAADNGELMNQDRREDMRKIIQRVLTKEKLETQGKVRKDITKKVEKALGEYFQTYTKNSAPYGIPKNLHSIAVTETRSLLNNVRKTYMEKVDDTANKEGYEMTKTWRQNRSLAKNPRKNHSALDGKTIAMREKFKLKGMNGGLFEIDAPHDYSLPPEEVITCNCDLYYKMRKIRKK